VQHSVGDIKKAIQITNHSVTSPLYWIKELLNETNTHPAHQVTSSLIETDIKAIKNGIHLHKAYKAIGIEIN